MQPPSHFVVYTGGRDFSLRIDPTQLPRGSAHYAEVCGYDVSNPAAGPLFRLPITVCRPLLLPLPAAAPSTATAIASPISGGAAGLLQARELTFHPGQIHRIFVQVPQGATWANLSLQGGSSWGGGDAGACNRLFMIHCLSVRPDTAFRDSQLSTYARLSAGSSSNKNFEVSGGDTLELCLAQYWSSLGASSLNVTLQFRSLLPTPSTVHLPAGGGAARVSITSHLRQERVQPSMAVKTRGGVPYVVSSSEPPSPRRLPALLRQDGAGEAGRPQPSRGFAVTPHDPASAPYSEPPRFSAGPAWLVRRG